MEAQGPFPNPPDPDPDNPTARDPGPDVAQQPPWTPPKGK